MIIWLQLGFLRTTSGLKWSASALPMRSGKPLHSFNNCGDALLEDQREYL
jgi:hypothetical protein